MADGRIIIDTQIDSSGAEKGINGLGNKLNGIAKVGLTAFTGAIAAATSGLAALGAIGVKYNSDMEQYMSSFTTMLGSADKATKHMNELKDFAAKTPFELSDLAKASTTLLSFGTNVKDVTPDLKMLGDISLGNKEKFNSLALVFGQVQSQGKLMGQDLIQMINAGFNPLQVISQKTGKSMAQLKDEMAKGQISFEMVADAMKIATSAGGQFYNAMEGQSKTLAGQWSTLKDNANALAGEVFVPLSDALKNSVLPTVNGYVDTLSKTFKEKGVNGLVGAVGEVLANVITSAANFLPKVVELVVKLIQSFISGIQDSLPQIISAGMQILNSLLTGLFGLLPQMLQLGIDAVLQFITGIGQQLPTLIPLAVQCLLTLVNVVIDNIPLLISTGMQIITGLIQGILSAIPQLIQNIPFIIQNILGIITSELPDVLVKGQDILMSLINGILATIPQLIAMLPNIINNINSFIATNLPTIIQSGISILISIINGVIQALPQLIAMLPTIITTIITIISQNLPVIIQAGITILVALINGLVNAIPQLIQMLPTIINTIIITLAQNLPQIITAGVKIIIAIISGLIKAIPQLIAAIPQIVAAIFKAFTEVDWLDIGVNILSGIGKGIISGIKELVGSAIKACKELKDNIKDFFGIHSPSRIMRDEVGKYLAQGIGVGFEDESENIQGEMQNSLSDLTAKMQATVDYETASTSNGIVASSNYKVIKDDANVVTNDIPEGSIFIIKNYMDSEEISEYTYKKVDGKFVMAGKRVR